LNKHQKATIIKIISYALTKVNMFLCVLYIRLYAMCFGVGEIVQQNEVRHSR